MFSPPWLSKWIPYVNSTAPAASHGKTSLENHLPEPPESKSQKVPLPVGEIVPPISTTEINRKIEETKKELEKWEEIKKIQETVSHLESTEEYHLPTAMSEEEEKELWRYHSKTTYRHIVFSGGAAGGLYIYGALKRAHEKGLWDYSNIRSVWGTSAGSILAICLILQYDWSVLDDYLIKRPWNHVFKLNYMRLWYERGLMGREVIEEVLTPLLIGAGFTKDITMKELFDATGIDLHIFTTELVYHCNEFRNIDISHKTHGNWRVVDAVYASSCLPIAFVPYEACISEDEPTRETTENVAASPKTRVFLDGGILAAFPFYHCIFHEDVDESEVLGFYLSKWADGPKNPSGIFDLFSYVKSFASAVFNYTDKTGRKPPRSEKACLVCMKVDVSERFDMDLTRSEDKRREYIHGGSKMCMQFLLDKGLLSPVTGMEDYIGGDGDGGAKEEDVSTVNGCSGGVVGQKKWVKPVSMKETEKAMAMEKVLEELQKSWKVVER
jgi:predicted acylesterase/phospholipase RssA